MTRRGRDGWFNPRNAPGVEIAVVSLPADQAGYELLQHDPLRPVEAL